MFGVSVSSLVSVTVWYVWCLFLLCCANWTGQSCINLQKSWMSARPRPSTSSLLPSTQTGFTDQSMSKSTSSFTIWIGVLISVYLLPNGLNLLLHIVESTLCLADMGGQNSWLSGMISDAALPRSKLAHKFALMKTPGNLSRQKYLKFSVSTSTSTKQLEAFISASGCPKPPKTKHFPTSSRSFLSASWSRCAIASHAGWPVQVAAKSTR